MPIDISIIIPTHNRCVSLRGALASLLAQEYYGTSEVIVIIDGCTDDTGAMLRSEFPIVKTVVFEKNVGAAVGLNAGSRAASGTILLFLDDDMEYQPSLVISHQKMHVDGDYDVIIGHFPLGEMPHDSFFRDAIFEWTEDWQLHFPEDVSFYDALCSGHFSIKRTLFQRVGGFDEHFSRWGRKDSELGYRLIGHGARFGFCKEAQAVQNYLKTPGHFLTDFELLGMADVDLCEKHPELMKTLLLSCFYQAPWPVLLLRRLLLEQILPSMLPSTLAVLFDALHARGAKGALLEGLLWVAADIHYWQGVLKRWDHEKFMAEIGAPVSILMYHRVCDEAGPFSVSTGGFRAHMQYLKDGGYTICSLSDAVDAMMIRMALPPKAVVITFDDGYADFVDAWQILREFGFPATLFLSTAYVGKTNTWNPEYISSGIAMLTVGEIEKLIEEGVDIQAHGDRHIHYMTSSPEDIGRDIHDNVAALQALGVRPRFFSYPSGEFTPVVQSVLLEAGFEAAVTCVSTLASRGADLMALPRITVEEDGLDDFAMRLSYGIGTHYARVECAEHIRAFRPAKYWHAALDLDPSRIYQYLTRRPETGPIL